MNELDVYLSANYREKAISQCGHGSFSETCTIEYFERKEKESQERDNEPKTYRELLERQSGLEELAKDNFLDK